MAQRILKHGRWVLLKYSGYGKAPFEWISNKKGEERMGFYPSVRSAVRDMYVMGKFRKKRR